MSERPRPRLEIAYVGPGLSGRRTSMQVVASRLGAEPAVLEPTPKHGLLARFTWSSDELEIAVHGTTGALDQPATTMELCARASAIVFVADSQPLRLEANLWACSRLYEHVGRTKPVVLQLNKRDLDATPVVSRRLEAFAARTFETIASDGTGVWDAFVAAAMLGARAAGLEEIVAAALGRAPA